MRLMPKDDQGRSVQTMGWDHSKTITATTSTQIAAFSSTETEIVHLFAHDDKIWIKIGADPTAVAEADDNIPIAPDSYVAWPVPAGMKVAAIGGKLTYAW